MNANHSFEVADTVPSIKTRQRRNSDVDGIHSLLSPSHVSPAQLYSTESGMLYHAGKICIVLVGLPARGKTHHAVALTRYLRWLGVKTHAFHLGDYRRKLSPPNFRVPDDYFNVNASPETVAFRKKVIEACLSDMYKFFNQETGQVAIYDAVNPTAAIRRALVQDFKEHNIQSLFVECLCTDERIVMRNIRDVKISSPDYQGVDSDEAVRHYLRRIELRIPNYETMTEPELSWVKLINVNERFIINNTQFGYLHNRIIFFLINSRIKVGSIYFARAGHTEDSEDNYKSDVSLSEQGRTYAGKLRDTIFEHLEKREQKLAQLEKEHNILGKLKLRDISQDSAHLHATPFTKVSRNGSLSSLDDLSARAITPPVASGYSTPTSPADARAASTIRADDLNMYTKSSLTVWSSTRRKTVETAAYFATEGVKAVQRTQLNQLNLGEAGDMTEERIKQKYPREYECHQEDPYHHRYPRAESYHDLAIRLEPLIMEMERISGDLLIIAHESVLRVLYGYLMACSVEDIPFLKFPRNEIVEVIPNAYINQTTRMTIPDIDP